MVEDKSCYQILAIHYKMELLGESVTLPTKASPPAALRRKQYPTAQQRLEIVFT